jgi:hypothetical protein
MQIVLNFDAKFLSSLYFLLINMSMHVLVAIYDNVKKSQSH